MAEAICVRVWNGDHTKYLGEGKYVGNVTVYFLRMPDGSLQSCADAENRPAEIPEGAELVEDADNPKIVLDDGRIVYGCQVWWEGVTVEDHQRALAAIQD